MHRPNLRGLYHPYGEACLEPDEGNAGPTAPARPTSAPTAAQRHEAGFGLMDYNARYYSPSLGRFISPDSIVPDPLDSQTFNRYAYGYNNPLKYTDPSGHSGEISDFLLGVVYEVTSNNYDGLLIPSNSPLRADAEALAASQTDNVAFQGGRIVGGIASAVQGATEIVGGAGTFVGGVSGAIVTSPTGVGIAAGAGVAAVGVGVAAHGAGNFFNGVVGVSEAGQNIFKAVTGGGGGSSRNIKFNDRQLQSKYTSTGRSSTGKTHAEDFGITGNWNKKNGIKFQQAIENHVSNSNTAQIRGTYRTKIDVYHYYNSETNLNVITDLDGNYISGWKLGEAQIENLFRNGNIQ